MITYNKAEAAEKLTILNSGSKTGGFSMQSQAYSTDLANLYDVNLVNPRDPCVALGSLASKIDGLPCSWQVITKQWAS